MSAKKAPPPGRQAKLARRVKRLERRIRSTERKEARQARLVERIRTRRATLDGRLASPHHARVGVRAGAAEGGVCGAKSDTLGAGRGRSVLAAGTSRLTRTRHAKRGGDVGVRGREVVVRARHTANRPAGRVRCSLTLVDRSRR